MKAHDALPETRPLKTLEDVFRWAVRRSDRLTPSDVVIQDEYTHDVIFVANDGSSIAFDATRLGAINGVSVWDHAPSADELLAARVARGWRPTASALKTGDTVLGHAACLVSPRPS